MKPHAHDRGAKSRVVCFTPAAAVVIDQGLTVAGTENHDLVARPHIRHHSLHLLAPGRKPRPVAEIETTHLSRRGAYQGIGADALAGFDVERVRLSGSESIAHNPQGRVVQADPPQC